LSETEPSSSLNVLSFASNSSTFSSKAICAAGLVSVVVSVLGAIVASYPLKSVSVVAISKKPVSGFTSAFAIDSLRLINF